MTFVFAHGFLFRRKFDVESILASKRRCTNKRFIMAEKGDLFISGEEMDQYFATLYLDELEDNEEIQMLFKEAVEEVCVQTTFFILCYFAVQTVMFNRPRQEWILE